MEYESRPAYDAEEKYLLICKKKNEKDGTWLCEFYNREKAKSRKEHKQVWKWQKNPFKNGWLTEEELAKYEADEDYLVKRKRQMKKAKDSERMWVVETEEHDDVFRNDAHRYPNDGQHYFKTEEAARKFYDEMHKRDFDYGDHTRKTRIWSTDLTDKDVHRRFDDEQDAVTISNVKPETKIIAVLERAKKGYTLIEYSEVDKDKIKNVADIFARENRLLTTEDDRTFLKQKPEQLSDTEAQQYCDKHKSNKYMQIFTNHLVTDSFAAPTIYYNDGKPTIDIDGEPMRARAECVIVDGDKIFIAKNRQNGLCMVPGGGIDEGEDFITTACRESREESLMDVNNCFNTELSYDNESWDEHAGYPRCHCIVCAGERGDTVDPNEIAKEDLYVDMAAGEFIDVDEAEQMRGFKHEWRDAYEMVCKKREACIDKLIGEEKDAVESYDHAIEKAEEHGDHEAAKLFEHIKNEEVEHAEELTELKKKMYTIKLRRK